MGAERKSAVRTILLYRNVQRFRRGLVFKLQTFALAGIREGPGADGGRAQVSGNPPFETRKDPES